MRIKSIPHIRQYASSISLNLFLAETFLDYTKLRYALQAKTSVI